MPWLTALLICCTSAIVASTAPISQPASLRTTSRLVGDHRCATARRAGGNGIDERTVAAGDVGNGCGIVRVRIGKA
ncbi:MAG: hypothetical protein R2867_26600 [Caldilineaceae bacterium]